MFFVLCMLRSAWSLGESLDIELLHESISPRASIGVDSPYLTDFGLWSMGIHSQYIRDALILYEDNKDQGAIVRRKLTSTYNATIDLSPKFGLRFSLPIAIQWATDHPSLARNGLGSGDALLGVKYNMWQNDDRSAGMALKTDLYLPVSTAGSWLGEDRIRGNMSVLGAYSIKNVELSAEIGGHFRPAVNTDKDFVLGNEVLHNLSVRWHLWPEHTAIGSTFVMRSGVNNLYRGGAETPMEMVNFLQWTREDSSQVHFGIGKGLNSGYGTSEFRIFFGYRFHNRPIEEEKKQVVEKPPPKRILPPIFEPEEEIEEWEADELARVEEDQIFIRDEIQFIIGTDTIKEESKPTVVFVAKLINNDVKIGHVVIEGHASEEGSFEYNYELSNLRARAIFKALVEAGVHPDRISHRGYGEALPKNLGQDEASLSENRRVEFHIVRIDPEDTELELRPLDKSPWDGSILEVVTPQKKVGSDDIDNPFNTDVMVPDDFFNPDSPTPETNPEDEQNESQNESQKENQNEIEDRNQTPDASENIDNTEEGKQ